jgi:hypothetical protein
MTDTPVKDYPDTGYTMSAGAFAAAETSLAWSAVEPDPDEPPHHHRAGVLKLASAIAAVALGVVVVVAVLLNPREAGGSQTPTTETAMPASQLPPISTPDPSMTPFVMPTKEAAHETEDGEYLQLMRAADLDPNTAVGGVQGSINEAHQACAYMRRTGLSPEALAVYYHMYRPDMSMAQMRGYVDAAVTAYCPELS